MRAWLRLLLMLWALPPLLLKVLLLHGAVAQGFALWEAAVGWTGCTLVGRVLGGMRVPPAVPRAAGTNAGLALDSMAVCRGQRLAHSHNL